MEVTNNTSETLIAFSCDTRYGYGKDFLIEPGQTKELIGPYVGEMGGGSCNLIQPGHITCQETPDDENGFQVGKGMPLYLFAAPSGVSIRHYSEKRDIDIENMPEGSNESS